MVRREVQSLDYLRGALYGPVGRRGRLAEPVAIAVRNLRPREPAGGLPRADRVTEPVCSRVLDRMRSEGLRDTASMRSRPPVPSTCRECTAGRGWTYLPTVPGRCSGREHGNDNRHDTGTMTTMAAGNMGLIAGIFLGLAIRR